VAKIAQTKTSGASTMEELLGQAGYAFKGFKRGDHVTGVVSEISGRSVYVDVGGKTEGIVAEKEYELSKDYMKTLKVGDKVDAVVVSPESDAGQIVLSIKRAAADSRWKLFEEAMKNNATITVKGKEMNKGGLLVEAEGVYGFIPSSQFSRAVIENPAALTGQLVEVKVIEVDREQNRLVLSEKAVTEAEEVEARKKALGLVEVGKIYKGTVAGIVPFGAFVSVKIGPTSRKLCGASKSEQSLEGLVHISEISWEKVEDVSKVLKEGDEVEVKVIGMDEDTGKLALSIKQLSDDPWKAKAAKYPVDSKHAGKVVKMMPYGVIVNLEKGIEGLIHASKMPAEMVFVENQEIEVFVESMDMEKRRLSLGVVVKDTKGMIYK